MTPSAKRRSPAIIRINNAIRDAFARVRRKAGILILGRSRELGKGGRSRDFSCSGGVECFGVRRRKRGFSCSGGVGDFRMTAKTLILAISAGSALPSFFPPARKKSAAPSHSPFCACIGETATSPAHVQTKQRPSRACIGEATTSCAHVSAKQQPLPPCADKTAIPPAHVSAK